MATRQRTLTVLTPIDEKRMEALVDLLAKVQNTLPADPALPFKNIRSIHYARWVILERVIGPDRDEYPATLLFSTQYDGRLGDHLDQLIDYGEAKLVEIYSCCLGFDAEPGPDELRLRRHLTKHAQRASAFYIGARGSSVQRIRWEQKKVEAIRRAAVGLSHLEPHTIWREIRRRVAQEERDGSLTHDDLGPDALEAPALRRQKWIGRLYPWLSKAAVIAGVAALLWWQTAVAAVIGILLLAVTHWLRLLETQDADRLAAMEAIRSEAEASRREQDHDRELQSHEDFYPQNQMTMLSYIKRSRLRSALQRIVLFGIRVRARFKFTGGLLHGVPTIHFAHWTICDQGRRLLFISNYDGSWSAYLDDFIAHGATAITAIWTHSFDFPKTRYLIFDGVTDSARFKRAARSNQVKPAVWYSAYPDLSLAEITNNSWLVAGLDDEDLGRASSRKDTLAWLGRI